MSWYSLHTFLNLPVPPSVNKAYRNVPGVGRVASKDLRAYRDEMQIWGFKNERDLSCIRPQIKDQIIRLDFTYHLLEKTLFTKAHTPKRYDVSNRIKLIEDLLCELLLTDDKFVFCITAEKFVSDRESVSVLLSLRESLPQDLMGCSHQAKSLLH